MKNARFLSLLVATLAAFLLLTPSFASAERLNKTIETLAAGQAAFGIFSGDRSLSNARSLSRSSLDYILIDMEHGPYDVETLQTFLLGMTNKAEIKATNSLTMNTTPIVRLPTNGREMNQYLVKQVLDMGVFGVMFPMINTREEAENAIASMRFPRSAGESDDGPQGLRGRSPGTAVWYWGTGYSEYLSKADVWPLDPQGELLAVI
ncbi:MAG: aldolase/citrate lyase family protein, partial [Luminiphilus sp.]|nr:aldolase/citrate lyase family protein [Luminiphilus sp.]